MSLLANRAVSRSQFGQLSLIWKEVKTTQKSKHKPLRQERGHTSHRSIQRTVEFSFSLSSFRLYNFIMVFPISLWERLPKTRWIRTPDTTWSWTTTFPTRTRSSYIQDPWRLLSVTYMVQSIADYPTKSLGFAQSRLFRDNNDNRPQIQLCLAIRWHISCLTPSMQNSENPPWNIKTLKTATSTRLLSPEQATTVCLIRCFTRQMKSSTAWQ